jgi:hypothetical protein
MTKTKLPHADGDTDGQARRILTALSSFLTAAPDRRVVLTFSKEGWRVELDETKRTSGHTLTDALAQAASVVVFEGAL